MTISIKNIINPMKHLPDIIKKIQSKLNEIIIIGESGGGMIKIKMNGNGEILSLNIEDEILKEKKIILQDLIISAMNDAKHKREQIKTEKIKLILSEFGLPSNINFPFFL